MQCVDCPWLKSLEDSDGDSIYFCMQKESPAYMEVSGILGNCDWNGYDALASLYHVTLRKNIPSIYINGLQPAIGELSKETNEEEPSIYVFTDKEEMENGLMNWLGESIIARYGDDEPLAILEINLPVSWLSDVKVNYTAPYEATISREIPADYIKFLDEDMDEIDPVAERTASKEG